MKHEESLFIPGLVGPLEAGVMTSEDPHCRCTAVVCHPHSLFGGTMENKVVTTITRTYREAGMHTIRFNFRGVGQSAGKYDAGGGEADDVHAVLQWVHAQRPQDQILLAGFSFGAYVAYRVASQAPASSRIVQLLTVAPPVNHFDFTPFPRPSMPWTVIQGDEDQTVPTPEVKAWLKTFSPPPTFTRLPGADHFFHGYLIELREAVGSHLSLPKQ